MWQISGNMTMSVFISAKGLYCVKNCNEAAEPVHTVEQQQPHVCLRFAVTCSDMQIFKVLFVCLSK